MSHFKNLNDQTLLENTKKIVNQERECTTLVIEHLEEVERRRLFAKLGYSSLWEYVTKELGYCAGSAQRRIHAMRFSVSVPEVKRALNNATVNLTSVAMLQQFVRNEKVQNQKTYSIAAKKELLEKISHQSSKQTEQLLRTLSPTALPREKEKPINASETEVRFVADQETLAMLHRMKEILSGSQPNPSTGVTLKKALRLALEKIDPIELEKRRSCRQQKSKKVATHLHLSPKHSNGVKATSASEVAPTDRELPPTDSATHHSATNAGRPYIALGLKRQLLKDANYRCTYVSSLTQKQCQARSTLQVEHKYPLAKGGRSNIRNLTILCAQHNRLRAIEEFGEGQMQRYLK